jgi:type I restriction enzyme S subunit
MGLKVFSVTLAELSGDSYLRIDVKYHSFFVSSNWNLFNSLDKRLIPLKDILVDDYTLFDYQEDKKYKGIPTGQIYLDEGGEIKDFLPISIEEHPERLKYKVSNENILLSSLRLAKSPALFFENEDLSEYVFSNGFYIFKVNDGWNKKFVYYILRTKKLKSILDNHIYRGIGISAYKKEDLLKIKIPLIPKPKQDEIVTRIEQVEKKIKELKATIKEPQEIINKVFAREFGFDLEKFEESKKQKFFEVEFSDFGKHRDLRSSVSDFRNYLIFEKSSKIIPQNKFPEISIRKILEKNNCKIIKKGKLEQEYLLVELENVGNNNGLIFDTKVVDEIGSEKLLFADADILTTKLRPYLGKTILNEFEKEAIGTIEWIPLKVNKKIIKKEYLFYILLSGFYAEKSVFLMSGKNHPRIKPDILFNFQIPNISLSEQQRIVDEIKAELDKQEKIKKEIEEQRNKIDEIIEESINQ